MKELNQKILQSVSAAPAPQQNRPAAESALREVLAPHAAGPRPPAANTTERKGGQAAKRRGRLEREVLAKLGKGLKDCFADVQRQEVPERFKVLLRQL